MFTRFNGNVVPFAGDATSTNRTVFGGTTQSDLIDDNLNTNFKKGWEIVGLNDNPTREDFNGMGYTLGALTAYLYEMGISEWNASQNYRANSRVTGSDGKIYKSLTGTTGIPNVGNNPITDAVNWVAEGSTDYSALIGKTTPVDADLIAIADSTSSFSLKKLTWANIKATLKTYFDTLYLALTGDQTVDGVKTFSSSPIVPTPTTNTQAANKAYVDSASSKTPAGTIITFASATIPDAYLKANGALVSRTVYSALFTAIGTTFGAGDGSTTFALPDLRGYFPRGWDDGRGIDASRIFGSLQNDELKAHSHTISNFDLTGTSSGGASTWRLGGSTSTNATGGTETRPKNIALLYCIKY